MNLSEFRKDEIATINTIGDFRMCGDTKHLVGKVVKLIKVTKSGMIQVEYNKKLYSIPPRNVDYLSSLELLTYIDEVLKKEK